MVAQLSYLAVGGIAYFVAALTGYPPDGIACAVLAQFIWIGLVTKGPTPDATAFALLVYYPIVFCLAAVVGSLSVNSFDSPTPLNSSYLLRVFPETKRRLRTGVLALVFLVLVGLLLVVYELDVGGFPEPWGAVILCVGLIPVSLLYYATINGTREMFRSADPGMAALMYIVWMVAGFLIWSITYGVMDSILDDDDFLHRNYNAYGSMIALGALGVLYVIIGIGVIRD